MKEVKREAERRKVELLAVPTPQAIEEVGTERRGDERDPPRDVLITGDQKLYARKDVEK